MHRKILSLLAAVAILACSLPTTVISETILEEAGESPAAVAVEAAPQAPVEPVPEPQALEAAPSEPEAADAAEPAPEADEPADAAPSEAPEPVPDAPEASEAPEVPEAPLPELEAEPEALPALAGSPAMLAATSALSISGDFLYMEQDGVATVVSYMGVAAEVTLPATLGGCSRIVISGGAFADCSFVRRVLAGEGDVSFESGALLGCARDVVLVGLPGSAAEAFAAASGIAFEAVRIDPESVSLSNITIGVGQTAALNAQLVPENASTTLSFSTSSKSIATVSQSGAVKGVRAGTATITVKTANGKTATCRVKVVSAPTSIALSHTSGTLGVGDTFALSYSLSRGSAAEVAFVSSNAEVASVDPNTGLVTARTPGSATITVRTHNGKKATCKVTVRSAPTSIVLSKSELTVAAGMSASLFGSVNEGAAGRVYYSSADESIARIDASGNVTGVAPGTVRITAYTYVEGVSATATVTVVPAPDSVTLPASAKLGVKDTLALSPVIPEGTLTTFTYKSSKTSVATVSKAGVVTAKARGTATITVQTANGKKATCKVTVVAAPSAIKLNASSGILGVGETYTLKYTLTKGTAATVTFLSSDESVASVDPNTGLVTALRPGSATIGVRTHNGKKATCKVTVRSAPTAIILSKSELTVAAGMSAPLSGSVNEGAAGRVYYSSADESIARIDASGNVTGVAPGTVRITAYTYVEGVSATATVTVVPAPDSVTLPASAKLGVKDTLALTPVIPEGTLTTFTYKSSKTSVATVSKAGVITAKARGTAVITVQTANGKKATCKVTVVAAPTAIKLNASSGILGVGETYTLKYALTKGTAATVTFLSSDESVASVDPNTGLVRALRPGSAIIAARTFNGKYDRCTLTVYKAPSSITLSPGSLEIGAGQTGILTGTVDYGAYGRVYYTSSNAAVATVNASGTVTGVAAGTAEITAYTYVEGVTATATVTVLPAPASVALPAGVTLGVKDTFRLVPEIPEGTMPGFTYSSANTKVATVSKSGVITAKAKGTAVITIKTYNGKTATCTVTVVAAPTAITLSHTTATLGVAETLQLTYAISSGTTATVTFFSSDPDIVSVDPETGLVTAHRGGIATISAITHNDLLAVCQITVIQAPDRVSLGAAERALGVGQSLQLQAELPEGSYSAIEWTSSDTSIVTVDANGLARGVAVGTANITASTYVPGVESSVRIAVKAAPASVSLPVSSLELASFDLYRIVPTVPGGSVTSFTYSSSNANIAAVDADGLVTAYEPGTATITVSTHNGKTAKLTVSVYDPYHPTGIAVGELPDFLALGQTLQIEYTFEPETAGREMLWTSTDPTIASVSESGLVTALSPGLTTLVGVSRRNSALRIEYTLIVLSETRALTIPARTTAIVADKIEDNLDRIRAIEGSAYTELYLLRLNGQITEAEYTRRVAVVKNAFAMYAFPWVTNEKEPYWKAANSEGGLKDFKTGVVYYGVPYTSNQSHRTFNVTKLLNSGYYTLAESGSYYVLDNSKFTDRNYKGSDCSSFAGMSYFGTASKAFGYSSTSFSTDASFKTIPWSQPLRTGDLLVASSHHVAIFLYYVDAAKTQIMIIDQGGGETTTNTVSCSIRKVTYYTERNYIIRRLSTFND